MRKMLMTTVAVVAVAGFATLAAAQTMEGQKGSASPQDAAPATQGGAAQDQKMTPGGSGGMNTLQKQSTQPSEKSTGQSAQAPSPNAKPNQRLGQNQQKEMTPQKGAQEENNKSSTTAQQKSGTTAQQNAGKSSSGGASVKLTDNQRGKIKTIIGKGSGGRVASNVHFDVTVGGKVPRDVHVAVLPANVVEIVPQYEGFDYIVVGDNILIIDPATMEIVAVIPA